MGQGPTVPTEELFNRGQWGHDTGQWRKLSLLWGYSDRWAEEVGETKSGDGTYLAATVAVPAGYVYVAQFAFLRNASGARGSMYIALIDGTDAYYALYQLLPARYTAYLWGGAAPLKEGDTVRFVQSTCLDGDVITAGVWGYKMALT